MPCDGTVGRVAVDPENVVDQMENSILITENYLQTFEVDIRVFSDVRFVERSTNL